MTKPGLIQGMVPAPCTEAVLKLGCTAGCRAGPGGPALRMTARTSPSPPSAPMRMKLRLKLPSAWAPTTPPPPALPGMPGLVSVVQAKRVSFTFGLVLVRPVLPGAVWALQ